MDAINTIDQRLTRATELYATLTKARSLAAGLGECEMADQLDLLLLDILLQEAVDAEIDGMCHDQYAGETHGY